MCSEGNKLKSLKGAPKEIGGLFSFCAENLESLEGLPKAREYFPSESGRYFDSVSELQAWFKEYKKELIETKTRKIKKGTNAISELIITKDIYSSGEQHGV